MNEASYPALFRSADEASNRKQRHYLWLVRLEYFLLFVAAVLSMSVFSGDTIYFFFALVFVFCLVMLLVRSLYKPEQNWHKCRALAESVKTLSWRYVMRAAPFENTASLQEPRSEFRRLLRQTFDENKSTARKIASDWSADDQITVDMSRFRSLDLQERKDFYLQHRIREQRLWYSRKAGSNRNAAVMWVAMGVAAYVIAAALVFGRIQFPQWQIWPIEPIIVFASSVIGWMQTKRFNELAANYVVAAHEIGFIEPKLEEVGTESELSDVVNEAELAFSREHTLWIARQTS